MIVYDLICQKKKKKKKLPVAVSHALEGLEAMSSLSLLSFLLL
jgi:hypothetical protein